MLTGGGVGAMTVIEREQDLEMMVDFDGGWQVSGSDGAPDGEGKASHGFFDEGSAREG